MCAWTPRQERVPWPGEDTEETWLSRSTEGGVAYLAARRVGDVIVSVVVHTTAGRRGQGGGDPAQRHRRGQGRGVWAARSEGALTMGVFSRGAAAPDAAARYVDGALPRLMGAALSLTGNRHDAEDLVQDTLAKVIVHWRRVESADSVDAYVDGRW